MIKIDEQNRLLLVFWVRVLTRALGILSICAGVVSKLPVDDRNSLSADYFLFKVFAENMWWILPVLLISLPIFEGVRRWAERQTLWPLVKSVLQDFRDRTYPNSKQDPEYAHRITLFKRSSWVWRLRAIKAFGLGWVRIVERTGHTTQNSRTVFRASNDPDLAEGVAGSTWARNQVLFVEDLPDLSKPDWEAKAEEYASTTSCPLSEIKQRRPRSRSLCGIPVEVKGRLWGVLVIDSRHPTLPKELIQTHYVSVAKHLGRLLERL